MSIKGGVRRIRCRLLVVTNTTSQKNRTADKYGFSQLHTNREESRNGDIWSVIGQSGLNKRAVSKVDDVMRTIQLSALGRKLPVVG